MSALDAPASEQTTPDIWRRAGPYLGAILVPFALFNALGCYNWLQPAVADHYPPGVILHSALSLGFNACWMLAAGFGLLGGIPRGWQIIGLLGSLLSGLNTLALILLADDYGYPMSATKLIMPTLLFVYFATRKTSA